jgi:hypothetical protein
VPVALLARSLVQMIPGSPFLARLQDGPWPAQVRLTSIWSREDGVSPYPSCVIDTHGLPQLANVEVKGDHRAFLVRKRIYEAVLHELRTAEAEAPMVRGPLTGLAGGRAGAPSAAGQKRGGATGTA